MKESDFHGINKSYGNLIRKIKKEKGVEGEFKTVDMDVSTRRRILSRLSRYSCEQVFVTVNVRGLSRINFDNKKDVVRYKNYVVRRLVDRLIVNHKIPDDCSLVELHIDNQNVAHSSIDSLEDHLFHYFNESNHYLTHKQFDTTSFKTDFTVFFKDSSDNYLIQAADLLANTKFNVSHKDRMERGNLRKMFKKGYTV